MAGAAIVYVAFRNMAVSTSRIANFQVQSAGVAKAGGVVIASFTVKNTGTISLDGIEIIIYTGITGRTTSQLRGCWSRAGRGGDEGAPFR